MLKRNWKQIYRNQACGCYSVAISREFVDDFDFTHFVSYVSFENYSENRANEVIIDSLKVDVGFYED